MYPSNGSLTHSSHVHFQASCENASPVQIQEPFQDKITYISGMKKENKIDMLWFKFVPISSLVSDSNSDSKHIAEFNGQFN